MKRIETTIPDVFIIEPDVFGDHRGYFMETWREEWFSDVDPRPGFVQDNQSQSVKNTLRGMHYQLTRPQGKYLRVVSGEIFDAVVDLRKSSSTFGQWVGVVLSEENKKSLWIPPGFAHGFYVKSESAIITYKCTDYYLAEDERSLLWNDPDVGIDWPLGDDEIVLSEKDGNALSFAQCEKYD